MILGKVRPALVEGRASEITFDRRQKNGKRKVSTTQSRSGLVPFFWLIRQANQKEDKTIIPSDTDIEVTAIEVMRETILGGAA